MIGRVQDLLEVDGACADTSGSNGVRRRCQTHGREPKALPASDLEPRDVTAGEQRPTDHASQPGNSSMPIGLIDMERPSRGSLVQHTPPSWQFGADCRT